jgi:hypothetical protein
LTQDAIAQQEREFVDLARERGLSFPIETKEEFVEQMTRAGATVLFRGEPYDAEAAARLMPEFFFPVASEEELVSKSLELLMSRGMIPLGVEP